MRSVIFSPSTILPYIKALLITSAKALNNLQVHNFVNHNFVNLPFLSQMNSSTVSFSWHTTKFRQLIIPSSHAYGVAYAHTCKAKKSVKLEEKGYIEWLFPYFLLRKSNKKMWNNNYIRITKSIDACFPTLFGHIPQITLWHLSKQNNNIVSFLFYIFNL